MDEQTKTPAQLEAEIAETRADIDNTLDALQQRLSPGQLIDQAIAYARTSAPREFASNLSATVRNNPVPVTLLGIGLAWLMISGPSAPPPRGVRGDGAGVTDRIDEGLDEAGARAGAITDRVGSAVEEAGAKMSRMADGVRDSASRVRSGAANVADQVAQRGRRIRRGARDLVDTARGGVDRARAGVASTRRGFEDMMQEQPLVLGAVGVAVGAVIAAALPGTRREDEWLGDTRDELVDRAAEAGQGVVRDAKEAVSAVGDTAQREVSSRLEGSAESAAPPYTS